MTAEPLYVPDDFGDGEDERLPGWKGPGQDLVNPDDPDSDYKVGDWWDKRSQGRGTPARPLVGHRCERIKTDGSRCKRWAMHGLRYCITHSGAKNLPNVREIHEQTVHNARMALLQAVPSAINRIEALIEDTSGEIPASVQLKASTEVLDRVGVRGGTEIDVRMEDGESPADTLRERLEQLRRRAAETEALAAGRAQIIEGEIVVDDHDGQLPLFADEDGSP
jgi:hypothetical protein